MKEEIQRISKAFVALDEAIGACRCSADHTERMRRDPDCRHHEYVFEMNDLRHAIEGVTEWKEIDRLYANNESKNDPIVGVVMEGKPFSDNTVSWLKCDGARVSKLFYADLYRVIGDNYGAPGGVTFALPDMRPAKKIILAKSEPKR